MDEDPTIPPIVSARNGGDYGGGGNGGIMSNMFRTMSLPLSARDGVRDREGENPNRNDTSIPMSPSSPEISPSPVLATVCTPRMVSRYLLQQEHDFTEIDSFIVCNNEITIPASPMTFLECRRPSSLRNQERPPLPNLQADGIASVLFESQTLSRSLRNSSSWNQLPLNASVEDMEIRNEQLFGEEEEEVTFSQANVQFAADSQRLSFSAQRQTRGGENSSYNSALQSNEPLPIVISREGSGRITTLINM